MLITDPANTPNVPMASRAPPVGLAACFDCLLSASQPNEARVELLDVCLDCLGRVALRVNADEHRLHLQPGETARQVESSERM
jgi:hypothetical protein